MLRSVKAEETTPNRESHKTLDCIGLYCPEPLFQTREQCFGLICPCQRYNTL